MKSKRPSSPARRSMKLLCFLLGIIFCVMLSATLYFRQFMQLPANDNRFFLALESVTSFLSSHMPDLSREPENQIGGRGSCLVNILLIGQDRRENQGRTRADSMILCSFNKDTRTLTMTSFLRDLYVDIPGHGSDRINAAYVYGGMPLLKRTLKENFSVHVDGCVEVDFDRFSQIIDLLGGVDLELRQDEAELISLETGTNVAAGWQHLDGFQALTYSRIRKLDADGDFSRTQRQRQLMSALLAAYKDTGVSNMLTLVKEILPMVDTDMGSLKLMMYAVELAPIVSGGTLVSQHVPQAGTFTNENINGMAVLAADNQAVYQLLRQSLLGKQSS